MGAMAVGDIPNQVIRPMTIRVVASAGTQLTDESSLIDTELPPPFVEWIEQITSVLQ